MKSVVIHTDGACSGNPGKGGWADILEFGGKTKEVSGFEAETTNNRMELQAVIEGFKALKEPCEVEIVSDSSYVVNAFTQGWLVNWKANGWRNKQKEEVKNIDLWKQLDDVASRHTVIWTKVKGHADNEFNNRCDKLAVEEIKRHKEREKNG